MEAVQDRMVVTAVDMVVQPGAVMARVVTPEEEKEDMEEVLVTEVPLA